MSSGGHSWHKKDWMTAALVAAAAAATAGAAGAFAPAAGAAGAGAGAGAAGGAAAGAGGAAAGAGVLTGAEMLTANGASMLPGLLGAAPGAAGTGALTGMEMLTASTAPTLGGLLAPTTTSSTGSALIGANPMSEGLLGAFGGMGKTQAAALAAQNAGLGFGADVATLNAAAGAQGGTAAVPWKAATALGNGLDKLVKNPAMPMLAGGLLGNANAAPPPPQASGGPPPQMQDTGPTGAQIVGNLANGGQLPPGITPEMLKDPKVIEMLRAKGIIV